MAKRNGKNENPDNPEKPTKETKPKEIKPNLAHLEKTNPIHAMGANHGKGGGRKPNLVKKFLEEKFGRKIEAPDMNGVLGVIVGLSPLELRELTDMPIEENENAAIVIVLAREMLNVLEGGDDKKGLWKQLTEFIRGRASEKIEVAVEQEFSIEQEDYEGLDEEDVEAFIRVASHLETRRKMKRIAASGGSMSDDE